MNTLVKLVFYSSSVLLNVFSWTSQALESPTFHIVDTNAYLSTPNDCNSTFTTGSKNKRSSTFKIVDRFGQCYSNKTGSKPSFRDIISRDQSRVESIHKLGRPSYLDSAKSYRYILPPYLLNASNNVVTIELGTPAQPVSFLFSTSSNYTFAQCTPLYKSSGEDNETTFFNSTASTTFSYITCDAPECNELAPNRNYSCYDGSDVRCESDASVDDVNGFPVSYAKDSLTLIDSPTDDVFTDFVFGCTAGIPGLEGNIAGNLGFSKNKYSFVSQINKVFSYCLPPNDTQIGYLRFGDEDAYNNTMVTNLVDCPTSYCINITAIDVAGDKLPINQSVFETYGAIIDSDTTYTYLPTEVYTQLRTAFKKHMTSYKVAHVPSYYSFDTCYDMSSSPFINVPTVSFTIGDVKVDLHPSGILVPTDNSTVSCLAFIQNSNYPDNMIVFGSTQQKGLKVMYDVGRGKIGFGKDGDCVTFRK